MASRSRSPVRAAGMSLKGRRALVTGGSKGIGRATTELFLQLGAEVAICARGLEELEKVKELKPERCHVVVADLSTQQGVKDWGDRHMGWEVKGLYIISVMIMFSAFSTKYS